MRVSAACRTESRARDAMADILKHGRGVQEKDVRGRHPPTHPPHDHRLPACPPLLEGYGEA